MIPLCNCGKHGNVPEYTTHELMQVYGPIFFENQFLKKKLLKYEV